jgi:hypothetical protein
MPEEVPASTHMSDDEFDEVRSSDDPFDLAIRSHQALDELLNLVISESLVDPHALEIENLGFALKVDLAAALGVIGDRPVFVRLNRIRNRFAHDRHAAFSQSDADDLFNCWSPRLRQFTNQGRADFDSPVEVLSFTVGVLFILLQGEVTRLRDEKLHARVLKEVAAEVFGPKQVPLEERQKRGRPSERIEARVNAERERRRAKGDL